MCDKLDVSVTLAAYMPKLTAICYMRSDASLDQVICTIAFLSNSDCIIKERKENGKKELITDRVSENQGVLLLLGG